MVHKTTKKNRKVWPLVGLIVLAVVILSAAGFAVYSWFYQDKILPHTSIGAIGVSGMSKAEATAQIDLPAKTIDEGKLQISYQDKKWETPLADLDLQYDLKQSAAKAFARGHSDNFWHSLCQQFLAIFHPVNLAPVYTLDDAELNNWIESIASEVDIPRQDANLAIKDDETTFTETKDGLITNQEKTKKLLIGQIENFKLSPFELPADIDKPQISREEAETKIDEAKEATKTPLKIKIGEDTFTAKPNTLGGWIKLKKEGKIRKTIKITFDASRISDYLIEKIAPAVDNPPKNARFSISSGKVTVYAASEDGIVLNAKDAAEKIASLLEDSSKERTIELKLEPKKAEITAEVANNLEKYGIREVIGSGTTDFSGSPNNRRHNIRNGADTFNGILIAPGEEFSTLKYLGEVNADTGYLPELVIKENETVPEFGGGLCQVSTTLFRAALDTGLKITERQNHSYRVRYYEPPVGMDATIYKPQPDLKFVNNTPGHILIQSSVGSNTITFTFYGTSDNRKVAMTDPYIYDVIDAGEPTYIDDPSLGLGEERYIEKAHPGAKASFEYTVTRGDETIVQQTFVSYYVPWRAKILIGPACGGEGQPGCPAPEEESEE